MTTTWKEAVKHGLFRFSKRHNTSCISRQGLLDEELSQIIRETSSICETPWQTSSRILQELRDEKILEFLGDGNYLLVDSPINVEKEDLPDDALDFAIKHNKLILGLLPADNQVSQQRLRKGQSRIRSVTLEIYKNRCGFCDVDDRNLLIAGHISRWADDPPGRGDLQNLICMCKFHDALFENGYFSLDDDYHVIKKPYPNNTISIIMNVTNVFTPPVQFAPIPQYLRKHRMRTGFESSEN